MTTFALTLLFFILSIFTSDTKTEDCIETKNDSKVEQHVEQTGAEALVKVDEKKDSREELIKKLRIAIEKRRKPRIVKDNDKKPKSKPLSYHNRKRADKAKIMLKQQPSTISNTESKTTETMGVDNVENESKATETIEADDVETNGDTLDTNDEFYDVSEPSSFESCSSNIEFDDPDSDGADKENNGESFVKKVKEIILSGLINKLYSRELQPENGIEVLEATLNQTTEDKKPEEPQEIVYSNAEKTFEQDEIVAVGDPDLKKEDDQPTNQEVKEDKCAESDFCKVDAVSEKIELKSKLEKEDRKDEFHKDSESNDDGKGEDKQKHDIKMSVSDYSSVISDRSSDVEESSKDESKIGSSVNSEACSTSERESVRDDKDKKEDRPTGARPKQKSDTPAKSKKGKDSDEKERIDRRNAWMKQKNRRAKFFDVKKEQSSANGHLRKHSVSLSESDERSPLKQLKPKEQRKDKWVPNNLPAFPDEKPQPLSKYERSCLMNMKTYHEYPEFDDCRKKSKIVYNEDCLREYFEPSQDDTGSQIEVEDRDLKQSSPPAMNVAANSNEGSHSELFVNDLIDLIDLLDEVSLNNKPKEEVSQNTTWDWDPTCFGKFSLEDKKSCDGNDLKDVFGFNYTFNKEKNYFTFENTENLIDFETQEETEKSEQLATKEDENNVKTDIMPAESNCDSLETTSLSGAKEHKTEIEELTEVSENKLEEKVAEERLLQKTELLTVENTEASDQGSKEDNGDQSNVKSKLLTKLDSEEPKSPLFKTFKDNIDEASQEYKQSDQPVKNKNNVFEFEGKKKQADVKPKVEAKVLKQQRDLNVSRDTISRSHFGVHDRAYSRFDHRNFYDQKWYQSNYSPYAVDSWDSEGYEERPMRHPTFKGRSRYQSEYKDHVPQRQHQDQSSMKVPNLMELQVKSKPTNYVFPMPKSPGHSFRSDRSSLTEKLNTEKSGHSKEIKEKTITKTTQEKENKTCNDVFSRMNNEWDDTTKRTEEKHDDTTKRTEEKHDDTTKRTEDKHDDTTKRIENKHDDTTKRIEDKHDDTTKRIKDKHDDIFSRMNNECEHHLTSFCFECASKHKASFDKSQQVLRKPEPTARTSQVHKKLQASEMHANSPQMWKNPEFTPGVDQVHKKLQASEMHTNSPQMWRNSEPTTGENQVYSDLQSSEIDAKRLQLIRSLELARKLTQVDPNSQFSEMHANSSQIWGNSELTTGANQVYSDLQSFEIDAKRLQLIRNLELARKLTQVDPNSQFSEMHANSSQIWGNSELTTGANQVYSDLQSSEIDAKRLQLIRNLELARKRAQVDPNSQFSEMHANSPQIWGNSELTTGSSQVNPNPRFPEMDTKLLDVMRNPEIARKLSQVSEMHTNSPQMWRNSEPTTGANQVYSDLQSSEIDAKRLQLIRNLELARKRAQVDPNSQFSEMHANSPQIWGNSEPTIGSSQVNPNLQAFEMYTNSPQMWRNSEPTTGANQVYFDLQSSEIDAKRLQLKRNLELARKRAQVDFNSQFPEIDANSPQIWGSLESTTGSSQVNPNPRFPAMDKTWLQLIRNFERAKRRTQVDYNPQFSEMHANGPPIWGSLEFTTGSSQVNSNPRLPEMDTKLSEGMRNPEILRKLVQIYPNLDSAQIQVKLMQLMRNLEFTTGSSQVHQSLQSSEMHANSQHLWGNTESTTGATQVNPNSQYLKWK